MSDFNQVLFQSGLATPLMIARWRSKGALKPLPPDMKLTEDDGTATDAFQSLWGYAFPSRANLPDEPLHDENGYITVYFHRVWH